MYRCLSCSGEYNDVGEDGVRYFHACSPTVYDFTAARGADGFFPSKARPNRRDENLDLAAAIMVVTGATGGAMFRTETQAPAKREGRGREEVA